MTISRRLGRRPVALLLAVSLASGMLALGAAQVAVAAPLATTAGYGRILTTSLNGGAVISRDGSRIYWGSSNSGVVVTDTSSDVETRITVPTAFPITMEDVVLSPDGSHLYAFNSYSNMSSSVTRQIFDISTKSNTVVKTITLPSTYTDISLTLSADGDHGFLSALDSVQQPDGTLTEHSSSIDTATDTVVATVDTHEPGLIPARGLIDPATSQIYLETGSQAGSATIAVFDPTTLAEVRSFTIPIPAGPLAFSPDGSRLYASYEQTTDPDTGVVTAGGLLVIDPTNGAVEDSASAPVGDPGDGMPRGLLISGDGTTIYSFDSFTSQVWAFDAATLVARDSGLPDDMRAVATVPDSSQLVASGVDSGSHTAIALYDGLTGSTSSYPIDSGLAPGSSLLVSPNGSHLYVRTNGDFSFFQVIDRPAVGWTAGVSRISGSDPYWQSVAASKAAYPGTAPIVYLAAANSFPDAVGSAAAAASNGGPLLLTSTTGVPAQVLAEIQRLRPKKIVTVGGTSAYGIAVAKSLARIHLSTVRRTGADRYATARSVLAGSVPASKRTVYVATGAALGAAPAAAAAAAAAHDPFLLVNGSASTLDAATRAALTAVHPTGITIVGGTASVSSGVASGLAAIAPVTRIAGASTSDTARLLDDAAYPSSASVSLATVASQTDDFAAITVAAKAKSPLELLPTSWDIMAPASTTCLPAPLENELAAKATSSVTLVGGTASLSPQVAALAPC